MEFDIKIKTNKDNEFIVFADCKTLNWTIWGRGDTLSKAIISFDKEFKRLISNKNEGEKK